jgi:hypothetical protein
MSQLPAALEREFDETAREVLADLESDNISRQGAVAAIRATYKPGMEYSGAYGSALRHLAANKSRVESTAAAPVSGPAAEPAAPQKKASPAQQMDRDKRKQQKKKKKEEKETVIPKHPIKSEKPPRLCGCGCGGELKGRWPFLKGHGAQPPVRTHKRQQRRRRSESTPPRKTAAKPTTGIATICVTEANLDNFWSRLSLEEKAALYQLQLEGA